MAACVRGRSLVAIRNGRIAEQLAQLPRLRLGHVARFQIGLADGVGLGEDHAAASVEAVRRHAHDHGEHECHEAEERADQHARRALLLPRHPVLPPSADPESDLVDHQRDDREESDHDRDRQGVDRLQLHVRSGSASGHAAGCAHRRAAWAAAHAAVRG